MNHGHPWRLPRVHQGASFSYDAPRPPPGNDEVTLFSNDDPITRLRLHLESRDLWDEEKEQELLKVLARIAHHRRDGGDHRGSLFCAVLPLNHLHPSVDDPGPNSRVLQYRRG